MVRETRIKLSDYNELIDFSDIKLTPLQAIKLKCKECCAFSQYEVSKCESTTCALYQFTHGKREYNISEEERERRRNLFKR